MRRDIDRERFRAFSSRPLCLSRGSSLAWLLVPQDLLDLIHSGEEQAASLDEGQDPRRRSTRRCSASRTDWPGGGASGIIVSPNESRSYDTLDDPVLFGCRRTLPFRQLIPR
jgi:hypothetical protein